jgi:hypothetical protein
VAIAPDGTTQIIAEVPGSLSGLGWLPDGTLLVVSMRDRKLLRIEDGRTVQHADLSPHAGSPSRSLVRRPAELETAPHGATAAPDPQALAEPWGDA